MKRMARLDDGCRAGRRSRSDEAGFVSGAEIAIDAATSGWHDGRMSSLDGELGARRLGGPVALPFARWARAGAGLACAERFLAEGAEVVLSDLDAEDSDTASATLARLGRPRGYICGRCDQRGRLGDARPKRPMEQRHGAAAYPARQRRHRPGRPGRADAYARRAWRRIMAGQCRPACSLARSASSRCLGGERSGW